MNYDESSITPQPIKKFKQKIPEGEGIQNDGINIKQIIAFIQSKLEEGVELEEYKYDEEKNIVDAQGIMFIPFKHWCFFDGEFGSYDDEALNFHWEPIN